MEIDETSIPAVKLGQEARVHIDAYPNQTFDGTVTEVGSSPITPVAGLQTTEAIKFLVKVQLKNPPAGIKPGLSVQADILTGFRPKVLTVPLQALVVRDAERKPEPGGASPAGPPKEEEGVFLLVGGKAEFKVIKTGLLGELNVEVTEGLKEGDTLISGPFRELRTLKPGDLVREQKPEESGPPRG
jgi:HlyD family secretion protein